MDIMPLIYALLGCLALWLLGKLIVHAIVHIDTLVVIALIISGPIGWAILFLMAVVE